MRQAARDYAQSVVGDEWSRLARHSYSPRSTELFRLLPQRVMNVQPAAARENVIYSDLVRMTFSWRKVVKSGWRKVNSRYHRSFGR